MITITTRKHLKIIFLLLTFTIIINCLLHCKVYTPTNVANIRSEQFKNRELVCNTTEKLKEETITDTKQTRRLMDSSGKYVWHPFYWESPKWVTAARESTVCLATHTSVHNMFWLVSQLKSWKRPLSVIIYAPGSYLELAELMYNYLKTCFSELFQYTSIHIAYPINMPGFNIHRSVNVSSFSCTDPRSINEYLISLSIDNISTDHLYPQNFLRNAARRSCPTKFVTNVDIDMIPVTNMSESLELFLKQNYCDKCVYIVSVYETANSLKNFPQDKRELLKLIKNKKARLFHIVKFKRNQGNNNREKWEKLTLNKNKTNGVTEYSIMYNITSYEEFWEPILVIPSTAPGFEERFVGYGFTRSSQVYLLHHLGYSFLMLDEAFLCHQGFKDASSPKWRRIQIFKNFKKYNAFKKELTVQ